MKNKLIYLPAVMPAISLYNKTKNGYISNFWDKEKSPFYYPYMLVSAYYGKNTSDFRKDFKIPDDVFILGDSGGFQQVTQKDVVINPIHVLNWQEKNCQAGLVLDYPPYEAGGTAILGKTTHDEFKKRLEFTKKNAEYSLKNKKDCKIYGVIQGDGYEQMKEWYDELNSIPEQFDGWALSPKPSTNLYKIALYGCFVMDEEIETPIHILQIGSLSATFVASYIRRKLGRTVTMDNSSFKLASRYGYMEDPLLPWRKFRVGKKERGEDTKLRALKGINPCMCPVCTKIGLNIDVENFSSDDYKFLDFHNLYHVVRYITYIDTIDMETFLRTAEKIAPISLDAIKMIDEYCEKGMDYILQKYEQKLNVQKPEPKQNKLFNF